MCGITAIYNKSGLTALNLVSTNSIVSHRGPDDEGYLLWDWDNKLQMYGGRDTALQTLKAYQYPTIPEDTKDWKVGLGHRRLSILDLSPGGHQPMVLEEAGLAITFNGEIYNFIELRKELEQLGHQFKSGSDTEVILHAWATWGEQALHRFNGMFSFVLLDTRQQKLYAVRDRFGVKPLYYTQTPGYMAFASEVKQLRTLPAYRFQLDEQIAYEYLRYSLIDHSSQTFDVGIAQVMPGTMVTVDISTGDFKTSVWYTLQPKTWKGTEHEACDHFFELLKDSVKLRMHSDVPVGSALSGGLDSSTIVCLMREVLTDQGAADHLIKTITSCQEDKRYDEWGYANEVVDKVNAGAHKVFPSFEKLQHDLEKMMWHMDYPFGSTSQFSQWCVFEEAKKQGLTVMINGQGADEQLAGYGGNDMALYTGLLGQLKWRELSREIRSYRQYKGHWPTGFVLGALQYYMPAIVRKWVPDKYLVRKRVAQSWIIDNGYVPFSGWPGSLRESLYNQVAKLPLPSLLRYEDRNSMAFSVESRVPFMDYRLIEFTMGLPENLVYRNGERKYILRKSFRGKVPDNVLARKDKMGFVSAEERWIKQEGKEWFVKQMDEIQSNGLIRMERALDQFNRVAEGKAGFNFDFWRMINFSAFLKTNMKGVI
ncbi:MAG: asparagine synthase (glutamine-hydrolyzing) [Cyclobacteriaceae bacterium]|nr:asparagine synthase (glutamine-hydrolyzing) [Cyclobacteriaceae bacterium]MCB9236647.1 asparagine synthase (glutamine-hydrolyzing) [Flammeovirgaceae bacterium]